MVRLAACAAALVEIASSVELLRGEGAEEDISKGAQPLSRPCSVTSEFILVHSNVDSMSLIRLSHRGMEATREMPARLVLPGHGDPILDHTELIDERVRMHRRRAARIHQILDGRPLSAYEIALQMWGNVAVTQAYLTLSEVLGHLDLLVSADQAVEHNADGLSRFEAM